MSDGGESLVYVQSRVDPMTIHPFHDNAQYTTSSFSQPPMN